MSRKFFAVNRETGERWMPNPRSGKQYLVMYDSGYLAVITEGGYYGIEIKPLDNKVWRKVLQGEETIPPSKPTTNTKVPCKACEGTGGRMEIVDHDADYNSVWERSACSRCNGIGYTIS